MRFFDLHVECRDQIGSKRTSSCTLLGLDSNQFVISKFDIEEAERRQEEILSPKGADTKQIAKFIKDTKSTQGDNETKVFGQSW